MLFNTPSGLSFDLAWSEDATVSAAAIEAEIEVLTRYIHRLATRRNLLRSPLFRLPPELLDTVIADRSIHRQNLKALSLASSVFLPHTRPRLFESVRISSMSSYVRALQFVRASPALYGLARHLHLQSCATPKGHDDRGPVATSVLEQVLGDTRHLLERGRRVPWSDMGHLPELLFPLTSVRELRLSLVSNRRHIVEPQTRDALHGLFAQITSLTLDQCRFTIPQQLVDLIQPIPALLNLSLSNVVVVTSATTETGNTPLAHLSRLSIDFSPDMTIQHIISALVSCILPRRLAELVYNIPGPESGDRNTRTDIFLRQFGHGIAKLEIRPTGESSTIEDYNLTLKSMARIGVPNLREFTALFNNNRVQTDMLPAYLRTLVAAFPLLETVTLKMTTRLRTTSRLAAFLLIADVLLEDPLSRARLQVILDVPEQYVYYGGNLINVLESAECPRRIEGPMHTWGKRSRMEFDLSPILAPRLEGDRRWVELCLNVMTRSEVETESMVYRVREEDYFGEVDEDGETVGSERSCRRS